MLFHMKKSTTPYQNIMIPVFNVMSTSYVRFVTGEFLSWCCSAFERLLEALSHQLCEMEKVMLQHIKDRTLLVPEPLHFLLPEPKGLVTVVYPSGVPDDQLETQRKVRNAFFFSYTEFHSGILSADAAKQ